MIPGYVNLSLIANTLDHFSYIYSPVLVFLFVKHLFIYFVHISSVKLSYSQ